MKFAQPLWSRGRIRHIPLEDEGEICVSSCEGVSTKNVITITTSLTMPHSSSWDEPIYDDVDNFTDGPIYGESSTAHLLSFERDGIYSDMKNKTKVTQWPLYNEMLSKYKTLLRRPGSPLNILTSFSEGVSDNSDHQSKNTIYCCHKPKKQFSLDDNAREVSCSPCMRNLKTFLGEKVSTVAPLSLPRNYYHSRLEREPRQTEVLTENNRGLLNRPISPSKSPKNKRRLIIEAPRYIDSPLDQEVEERDNTNCFECEKSQFSNAPTYLQQQNVRNSEANQHERGRFFSCSDSSSVISQKHSIIHIFHEPLATLYEEESFDKNNEENNNCDISKSETQSQIEALFEHDMKIKRAQWDYAVKLMKNVEYYASVPEVISNCSVLTKGGSEFAEI